MRGIHPPVLADRGLVGAVQALALAAPIAGDGARLDVADGCRHRSSQPRYFAIAEALTNVIKHSGASSATVELAEYGDELRVAVSDEGIGGADPGARDRVAGHRAPPRRLRRHASTCKVRPAGRPGWLWCCRAPRLRVVLAEDLALLRDGLIRLLEAHDFEVVEAVDNGPSLLRALAAHRPDVAVVDVRLPPTFTDEGLRAAIEARAEVPGLPVLVLSQYVEQLYARELLADRSGGVGYLLKDRVFNVGQFIDAVRQVAAGGTAMDPEVVAQLLSRRASDVRWRR